MNKYKSDQTHSECLKNKAYRPNGHLLDILMHYNGNIMQFYIIIITT